MSTPSFGAFECPYLFNSIVPVVLVVGAEDVENVAFQIKCLSGGDGDNDVTWVDMACPSVLVSCLVRGHTVGGTPSPLACVDSTLGIVDVKLQ